jgi:hypothetical protein
MNWPVYLTALYAQGNLDSAHEGEQATQCNTAKDSFRCGNENTKNQRFHAASFLA